MEKILFVPHPKLRQHANTIDKVTELLLKKHKIAKEVLPVTGRADVCVLMQGSINDINTTIMDFKKIGDIVATETLMEMEVDLGW